MNSDTEMLLPDGPRKSRICTDILKGIIFLFLVIAFVACCNFSDGKMCSETLDRREAQGWRFYWSNFYGFRWVRSPQVYIFGGVETYTEGDFVFRSSGAHFNSCNGKWNNISSMPYTASNMCGAVIDDKVYLFGGFTGDMTNTTSLDSAMVYDSSADTYTTLQLMPEPRGACGAAVLGDYIYVVGGSKSGQSEKPENLVALSSVIRYNIKTDQWSTVQSMKAPRNSLQLVTLEGRLYAIGGERLNTFEVYDPTADQWTLMSSSKFSNFGATVLDDKIYVIDSLRFEVYSPDIGEWKSLSKPEYLQKYHFTNLLSIYSKLWTMGIVTDNDEKVTKTIFSYDPATKEWTEEQDTYSLSVIVSAFFVVKY